MKVTVFEKPSCTQCYATKRWLDKEGVEYETKSILENEEAVAVLKEAGYASAPGVFLHGKSGILLDCWGGYNPGKLKTMLSQYREELAEEYLADEA